MTETMSDTYAGMSAAFLDDIELSLREFLALRHQRCDHPLARQLLDFVSGAVLSGGKRLRPLLCYWGWRGAGGQQISHVMDAACALELLHSFALIHDDIMDASETRRGQACVHTRAAAAHRHARWRGDSRNFGAATGILAGDLAAAWADELMASGQRPSSWTASAYLLFCQMRGEVVAGQYLDLLGSACPGGTLDPQEINRLKTTFYTVVRPLQIGGALAGAPESLLEGYLAVGEPLGQGFQLRDDVLGLYGDQAKTGKSTEDDLRSGKQNLLMSLAFAMASPSDVRLLGKIQGNPEATEAEAEVARRIVRESGALARVEQQITCLAVQSRAAISQLPVKAVVHQALTQLTRQLTERER